jgi:hypothetical protein
MKPFFLALALILSIPSFATIGFSVQTGLNAHKGPFENSQIPDVGSKLGGSIDGRLFMRLNHFEFGWGAATGSLKYSVRSLYSSIGPSEYGFSPISYNSIYTFCNYRIQPHKNVFYYAGGLLGSMNMHGANGSKTIGSAYGGQVGCGYQVSDIFVLHSEIAVRNCPESVLNSKYLYNNDYVYWYYHFEIGFSLATAPRKKRTSKE